MSKKTKLKRIVRVEFTENEWDKATHVAERSGLSLADYTKAAIIAKTIEVLQVLYPSKTEPTKEVTE